ncbi:hypothetical protein ACFYOG_36330 [Streptomyces sp. NPDC007818]|uniref:hypothetical protein n=1 Tax=Streptomyces sp. NPDC007818 TaxID=3364780 RepID=UPI0036ACF555
MSLTSELSNPHSAVSRFMNAHLPATAQVTADLRGRLPLRPVTIKPQSAHRFDYRSLGRAIDRRLRVAFGSPLDEALKAGVLYAPIDVAEASTPAAGAAVRAVGAALLDELQTLASAANGFTALERQEEERLARLCFVASHFEEVYRAGLRPGNPLTNVKPGAILDDLLGEVPSYVPEDIGQQMKLAEAEEALGWAATLTADQRICAPVFSGSLDVKGADADYILDGRLIDCKATIRPDRIGEKKEIHQLAGYLLLDYEDTYALNRVGLYLARQGRLLTWTTEEFLRLLGARRPIPKLRAAFRKALTNPQPPPPPNPTSSTQTTLFD